jgi:hypothetical protein
MKSSDIKMRYCSLFLLIEILLFLFQSLNGIVSAWGIVPTIITVIIFINIIKQTSGKPKVEHQKLKIVTKINKRKKSTSDEVPVEESDKNLYYKELNNKNNAKKGGLTAKIIALILFLVLGGLFIFMQSNQTLNSRQKVVKADIYTQQIIYDYEEYNRLTVSYEYNGRKCQEKIEIKTGVVHAKHINLVINGENGVAKNDNGYAKTADYLSLFTILAVVMFICAGIMVLSLIYKASGTCVLFTVFFAFGLAFTFAVNLSLFASILYNPMTVFFWCFMSVGLYGIATSFLLNKEM